MAEAVVITGCAAVTGLGTLEQAFDALCAGRSSIGPVRGFDASGFVCGVASQIDALDAEALGVSPRDARTMGFHSFSLIAAARGAYAAARLGDAGFPRERIAFFTGMGMVDCEVDDLLPAMRRSLRGDGSLDYEKFYSGEYRQIHPLWPLCTLNNMALAQAAIDLDIRGDNTTFSPYGESGAQALREAERSVAEGAASAALASGAAEKVSPQSFARHQRMGLLSPSGRLLPFGTDRDGSVLGEAAAAIVFERADTAEARGLRSLAVLAGYAMRFAASSSESVLAAAIGDAMREALGAARAAPPEVSVIFAHGDGRKANDGAEARAIAEVFGPDVPVTATKAAVGNTLAASAPLDAGLAVIALQRGEAPPCASGQSETLPGLRLVRGSALRLDGRTAVVNVQGLSGQCASLVLRAGKE